MKTYIDDMTETMTMKCPICGQGEITILYTPKMMVTRYGRAASNKKAINYFRDEKYEVLSDKCPNCGKPKKEIEKALREGKELSNNEVLRRLRGAGLDPTKLK